MGRGSGNSRNGSTPKTVTTEIGEVDLAVPRDRAGTFCPLTVPKHRRRLDGLSGNVISLYAKGLTTGEIQDHLAEIYDTSVSRETISKITEGIVADMAAWQNRTARPGLCGAGFDAIVIKALDSQVANRPVYVAIGVDLGGERDVLGMWLGPSGSEGATQWATMLTELRNRGLADASVRVLRRPARACPRRSGRPGPKRPCRPASFTWSATAGGTRPPSTGARSPRPCATSLHLSDRRGRRAALRDLRRRLGRHLPRHDRVVAQRLRRIHPVPGVPRRAAQSRLHHQRHRKPQRQIPPGSAPSRALTATNKQ